jgi:hypothetical protein
MQKFCRVCGKESRAQAKFCRFCGASFFSGAVPSSSVKGISRENSQDGVINKSTRLVSGSTYRQGIRSGFRILNRLRTDQYKAISPESGLDLDIIATHAAQAISISLIFAIGILAVWLLKLLMGRMAVEVGAWAGHIESTFLSKLWRLVAGALEVLGLVLTGAAAFAAAYEKVYLRWAISSKFLKKNYQPNLDIKVVEPIVDFFKRCVESSRNNGEQNVITFGGFRPFLGAGERVTGWSLSIPRASVDDGAVVDIPVADFYSAVDTEVASKSLPYLQQLSRLYVNGLELDVDGQILRTPTSRPTATLPQNQIWSVGQSSFVDEKRAYRVYRYFDKKRDVMLSYFLHFNNIGNSTFVEGVVYTLPSIDRQRFSLSPLLKDSKLSRLIKTFIVAVVLFLVPFSYLLFAVWHFMIFLWNIFSWWLNDMRRLRAVRAQEEYNYGLCQTFRESIAATTYQNYYGIQDLTMYWQTLDRAIINGMLSLLKQKGVDTSMFEETTQRIVNHGVLMNGGEFTASQVAVGQRSVSVMSVDQAAPSRRLTHALQSIRNQVTSGHE